MNKFIILTATSLTLAFAAPALASDDDYAKCGSSTGQWLPIEDIRSKIAAKGYDVRSIKRDDNCYEAYAIDKNGSRVEIYMNPTTGKIVKIENKS